MDKYAQIRELRDRIAKQNRISTSEATERLADMVDRSPATVKRWLSVRPDGRHYPFPTACLALALARQAGKM